ncbi:MAG: 2-isopropylmalate synthase [Magnetococcales bacterium]|nr:2-isopropylmalate synthase [Magnetococcales bacterium]
MNSHSTDATASITNTSTPAPITLFDTTLRDGEQSPGIALDAAAKVEIARLLSEMGVSVVEAGFPITSRGDFAAVEAVARAIGRRTTVCALSRARREDIETAAAAIAQAEKRRIHCFIGTSPLHRRNKLGLTRDQVVEQAVSAIRMARNITDDVEFSPEDATRTESAFLTRVITAAIDAGATTINLPDTVGCAMPGWFGTFVRETMENVRQKIAHPEAVRWSVHCHNDLGLATANSIAAIQEGVDQVECTVNGIGERAGNAALEEVVMAMTIQPEQFPRIHTVDTGRLGACSQRVSALTGYAIAATKPVVGRNAFAHESGIHQDGVLKCADTYEIMRPEQVGWHGERIVLGKHSGRHAFHDRMRALGYEINTQESRFRAAFQRFKQLAERSGVVDDTAIHTMMRTL